MRNLQDNNINRIYLLVTIMEEVCSILQAAGFDEATVEIFCVNKVDCTILLDLDKDDMKELGVTALGDRKKLLNIIAKLKKEIDSITN